MEAEKGRKKKKKECALERESDCERLTTLQSS